MQQTIIVEKTKEENRVALQISANVTPLIPKHFFWRWKTMLYNKKRLKTGFMIF